MKKILCILMTLVLVFNVVIISDKEVFAEQNEDFYYCITDYAGVSIASISSYTGPGGIVTVPSSLGGYPVEAIESYSFEDCTKIKSIIIPDSVTHISRNAFSKCTGLTNITFGNNVNSISAEAFRGCTSLTSVTIPASVTELDNSAFLDCSKLTEINVLPNNTKYSSMAGVLFNKSKSTLLQYPCGKTGNYIVQNYVSVIADYSFYRCIGIANVNIADSVTSIGAHAFNLSSVTNMIIPSSVGTIGEFGFAQAKKLKTVTIGSGVGLIGKYAFNSCRSLVAAIFQGDAPILGPDAFARCGKTFKVYYGVDRVGFTNPWRGYTTTSEVYVTPSPSPTPTPTPANVAVTGVSINKTFSIVKGKTFKLILTILPVNATNKKVTWKSSNTKIVTVTSAGVIKGIKKGSAIVYVFTVDGMKTAACKVTVK